MGIGFTQDEWSRFSDAHIKEKDKKITDFIVGAILMIPAIIGIGISVAAIII